MCMENMTCLNLLSISMNRPLVMCCEKRNTSDAFSTVFDLAYMAHGSNFQAYERHKSGWEESAHFDTVYHNIV